VGVRSISPMERLEIWHSSTAVIGPNMQLVACPLAISLSSGMFICVIYLAAHSFCVNIRDLSEVSSTGITNK